MVFQENSARKVYLDKRGTLDYLGSMVSKVKRGNQVIQD